MNPDGLLSMIIRTRFKPRMKDGFVACLPCFGVHARHFSRIKELAEEEFKDSFILEWVPGKSGYLLFNKKS